MPRPALTIVDGRAVNAADRPLAEQIEACLVQAEELLTATLTRQSYWQHIFDNAAKPNPLARHLCQREATFLAGHHAAVAALHGRVTTLSLYLRAEGYL